MRPVPRQGPNGYGSIRSWIKRRRKRVCIEHKRKGIYHPYEVTEKKAFLELAGAIPYTENGASRYPVTLISAKLAPRKVEKFIEQKTGDTKKEMYPATGATVVLRKHTPPE